MPVLNRRALITGFSATGAAMALAGCATRVQAPPAQSLAAPPEPPMSSLEGNGGGEYPSAGIYGEVTGKPFPIPAVKLTGIDPAYLRTAVRYDNTEEPGTIIVDPSRNAISIWCRTADAPCVTESALAVKDSAGQARRPSMTSRNGQIGIHPRR
jgi:hypothetical protein